MKIYQLLLAALGLVCFVVSVGGYEGELRVENPENDDPSIERPCKTYDLNCIRKYFRNHGRCKENFGPVPDNLSRPQSNFYIPRVNLSVTVVDQRINGLNGMVEEFYINRKTDKLVLAVEFRDLTQRSDKIFFTFHRRAREPIVTTSRYIVNFDRLTITAVIPKIDDLRLHDAECTTFYDGQALRFAITPGAVTRNPGADPQPAESIAMGIANLREAIQEFFLTESAYLISTYIQYNICDFGLFLT